MEWKNNSINRNGEFFFNNGDKYNGNWKDNKFDEELEFTQNNGINIMEIGEVKKSLDMGFFIILMEINMKENGLMI